MNVNAPALIGLFAAGVAAADEFSVLSYGTATPGFCEASPAYCSTLKGPTAGLGVEWEFSDDEGEGTWISRVSSYPGPLDRTGYFAGAGWRREWPVSGPISGGVTLFTGYLGGPGRSGLMTLPLLSLGSEKLRLELGYLPGLNLVEVLMNSKNVSFAMSWMPNVNLGPDKGKTSITTFNLRGAF
ncbi:hypothetical protein [Pseudogulbenkiania sp. MAI-1]|uniref:hypothetical protein n=1 Tax=Pseudogulbenkiania sp. MAI-1 TaxID=990370 RepID=UPI00045E6FA9|nr:hypothetical protein [Pseudogulbenkiania sp. MAI-1]